MALKYLLVGATILSVMLAATTVGVPVAQNVQAQSANCDKAGLQFKEGGGVSGNAQCNITLGDDDPPEPIRSCGHKNQLKDHDGDGAACVNRGSN